MIDSIAEVIGFGDASAIIMMIALFVVFLTVAHIVVIILSMLDKVFDIFHPGGYLHSKDDAILQKKTIIDAHDKEVERIIFYENHPPEYCRNYNELWFKFMYYVQSKTFKKGIIPFLFTYGIAVPTSIFLYAVTFIFDRNRFIPCNYCGKRSKTVYGFCSACTPADLFKASISYHDEKLALQRELDRELEQMGDVIMREFYRKSKARKEFVELRKRYWDEGNGSVRNNNFIYDVFPR